MKSTTPLLVLIGLVLSACVGSPRGGPQNAQASPTTPLAVEPTRPALSPTATPTLVPTATITPLPTLPPTPIPTRAHPTGRLITHPADQEILYDWFSYVPIDIKKRQKVYIWIATDGTMPLDDYSVVSSKAKEFAQYMTSYADKYNYVFLTLAIPRPSTNHIYVIAYNRKVFLSQTPAIYRRPDLQLNKMIDRLTDSLRQDGFEVSDKVLISGYSAGGMFAQRYALLNPERVMAVAGGQCGGSLTVPDPQYDWPVGIRDFEKLTGSPFSDTAYRSIPQWFYIGDLDMNNSTAHRGNVDVFSSQQIDTLFNVFGTTDPPRLSQQVKHMNELGYTRVLFTLYPGIKHEITDQMMQDTYHFFETYR